MVKVHLEKSSGSREQKGAILMYKIVREGKRVPKNLTALFESYDVARQAVRKWLLQQVHKGVLEDNETDAFNRTISIGKYGFSIKKFAIRE